MKKIIAIIVFMFLFVLPVRAENINVAFTIDNNYPIFTMLVINSILRNNTSNSDYTFYVIENNLTAKNKLKMQKYVNKRKQTVEFINVDTSIIDEGNWFFWFSNRITSIAMARILIPDILPKQVQKVIYMDADTLVLSDLKDLYDIDLDGKAFGMTENIAESDRKIAKYYNSGVILMDLNKCRAENSTLKMLNFVKTIISYDIYSSSRSYSSRIIGV